MTFQAAKPRVDDIADVIRKRICLQPLNEQTTLLEGALATEFGVSRTPVRQALQRLAYEGLIEVRTGVGSIANPLDPAARGQHITVHGGLLRLVGNLPDAPVPHDVMRRLSGLAEQTRQWQPTDATTIFDLFSELNENLSKLIQEQVIADAHLVSGWRIVRWFLADLQNHEGAPVETLVRLCRAVQNETGNGRAALFRAAADVFDPGGGTPAGQSPA